MRDYYDEEKTWYDTAQICLNGHEINRWAVSSPESNQKHCQQCGAATIQKCSTCDAAIRGYVHIPGVTNLGAYEVPAHCHECGKPYPWTEATLRAAKELSDELENLTSEEKEMLKKSIDGLITDTPQTTLSATRFKRLISKAGKPASHVPPTPRPFPR